MRGSAECHYCGSSHLCRRGARSADSEHLYYSGAGSEQGEARLTEIFSQRPDAGAWIADTVRGRYDLDVCWRGCTRAEINLLWAHR